MSEQILEMPARDTYAAAVAGNVRAELARAQIQQAQVQQLLGRSQAAVSARLRGVTPFTVAELAYIAELLGLTVPDLLPAEPASVRPPGLEPGTQWFRACAGQSAGVVDLAAYRATRAAVGA